MPTAPRNVAASVRARLFDLSKNLNEDFLLVLKRYAIERLLYRLGESPYHNRFTLKGAMLFAFWGQDVYRTTRDLDLLGNVPGDLKAIAGCVREIASISVSEDGIIFLPDTLKVEEIRNAAEYGGIRVHINARLEQAIIPVQIDIGLGDAVYPPPEKVTFPTLLGGPAPRIQVYSKETVIAEKFHSMVILGMNNSRMKDFYDLYVISQRFHFEGRLLAKTILITFERRRTPLPASLPPALSTDFFKNPEKLDQWRGFIDRIHLTYTPPNFSAIGEALREFLWPLVQAINNELDFDTVWSPGGPWR